MNSLDTKMIHLVPYGQIPKSYKDTKVHYLTSRNTIYGVHRHVVEENYSKTSLVCFSDMKHAIHFRDDLVKLQASGKILERCVHFPNVLSPSVSAGTNPTGSRLPISITTSHIVDIMKLCHLNFFDMYLVFDTNRYDEVNNMSFSYYQFATKEIPSRGYINCHFEQLL